MGGVIQQLGAVTPGSLARWLANGQLVDSSFFPSTVPPVAIGNIAALRALLVVPNIIVSVLGYYALNDGGGGFFVYDASDTTSVDNGGTVIVSAGGFRWKRQYSGPVEVLWFGASLGGSINDTPAINAAYLAAPDVRFWPGRTFLLGATVVPQPGSTTWWADAIFKLNNGVNNHMFRPPDNSTGIRYVGAAELNGNKTNNSGGHGIASGAGVTSMVIEGQPRIHDCSGNGIYIGGGTCTGIKIWAESYNNALAGITCDDTVVEFEIGGIVYGNGTHGCGAIGTAKNGRFYGRGYGNGPGADDFTGYNSACENVVWGPITSRGALNNGVHAGGNNITYEACDVWGAAQYGVCHKSFNGMSFTSSGRININGCTAYSCGNDGFYYEQVTSGTISGTSENNAGQGVQCFSSNDIAIRVTSKGNGGDGVRGQGSTDLAISGVMRNNIASGVRLDNCTSCTTDGVVSKDNSRYGYDETGTSASNNLGGSNLDVNGLASIGDFAASSTFGRNNLDGAWSLASATSITLLGARPEVYITGTTNIQTITATFRGDERVLQFDGVLLVKNGTGNIILNGSDFTTQFHAILHLMCDGTSWFEIARASN